jgi:putative membrane protein
VEGAQGMRTERSVILIFIIILFHAVGVAGLSISFMQLLFLAMVPFHLLLMLILICISHQQFDLKFVLFFVILFIFGYAVEWFGVHQHFLFGNYTYGDTLGFKLSGVPVIIGVNWLLLTYASGVFAQRLFASSVFARVVFGAFIMVMMDVIIEPAAIRLDYWHWQSAGDFLTAPLINYISWFGVSAIMLIIFETFAFKRQSRVAIALLFTQALFFILLYLV